ncbi:MAG: DUF4349 domain-containing protein [Acidobacteriota bacterium]
MTRLTFVAIFVGILAYAGCGGARSSPASNSNTAGSSVSKSQMSPDSLRDSGSIDEALSKQSSNTSSGGGGGGGRNQALTPVATNISIESQPNATVDTAPTDRKIVRNAELSLEADSPEQAQQTITSIAESKGGFVVESQQSSSDTKVRTSDVVTMTVRVPSAKFLEALDEIRKTGSRVIVETIKGTDVTEEFIDIEARLKAQMALEQQFIEIMKKANSVDDALNVQRQLADVRGEIEKVEGRRRFLENQASLSTVKVKLQSPVAFSANSSGFGYRLKESFSAGFDFASSFVLGLVTLVVGILPFAVLIGLPGFFIVRYFMRRRISPKSMNQIIKEEMDAI